MEMETLVSCFYCLFVFREFFFRVGSACEAVMGHDQIIFYCLHAATVHLLNEDAELNSIQANVENYFCGPLLQGDAGIDT